MQAKIPSYLENALEMLDESGEWYLDRPARTVYYMPRPGEDMAKAEVIAPALEKLVELRGTLDQPVHNIRFQGITFAHGGWLLPSKIGFVGSTYQHDPCVIFFKEPFRERYKMI